MASRLELLAGCSAGVIVVKIQVRERGEEACDVTIAVVWNEKFGVCHTTGIQEVGF